MKKFMVIAALLAASVAQADRVYEDHQGNKIVFKDTPCTLASALENVPPQVKAEIKDAVIHTDGKVLKACYRESGQVVVLIDENGEVYGPAPKADLGL